MTLSTQRHLPLLLAAGIAASVTIQPTAAQTVVTQWDQFAMAGITAAGPAMAGCALSGSTGTKPLITANQCPGCKLTAGFAAAPYSGALPPIATAAA